MLVITVKCYQCKDRDRYGDYEIEKKTGKEKDRDKYLKKNYRDRNIRVTDRQTLEYKLKSKKSLKVL